MEWNTGNYEYSKGDEGVRMWPPRTPLLRRNIQEFIFERVATPSSGNSHPPLDKMFQVARLEEVFKNSISES